MTNPYSTLGVEQAATQDEIKNAYRNLAKKYHPDLNPGNKAAETKFKDLSGAYELIGSPEARAKFDRGEIAQAEPAGRGPFYNQAYQRDPGGRYSFTSGTGPSRDGSEGFEGGFNEDIFEQLFKDQKRRSGPMPGQDVTYEMEIDVRDAILGAQREFVMPHSQGAQQKKLSVKIPAGMVDGSKLRFAGKGMPGVLGGPPGDAFVMLKIKAQAPYEIHGSDLWMELSVSLTDALLGSEVRVTAPDSSVMLKIPKLSNNGTKLRIPGKGLFSAPGSTQRGNLLVQLKVVLPSAVDAEFEEALRSWSKRQADHPRDSSAA